MARYIDIDKVELKGLAVFDENLDVLVPLSVVRKALQMTPTADVAPKSEVAMEIFEDILKIKGLELHDWVAIAELKNKYTGDQT